jgi:hypothetical protein
LPFDRQARVQSFPPLIRIVNMTTYAQKLEKLNLDLTEAENEHKAAKTEYRVNRFDVEKAPISEKELARTERVVKEIKAEIALVEAKMALTEAQRKRDALMAAKASQEAIAFADKDVERAQHLYELLITPSTAAAFGDLVPITIAESLPNRLFAVCDPTNVHHPLGVAFFVNQTTAITAYHVVQSIVEEAESPKVSLLRESDFYPGAQPRPVDAVVFLHDVNEDWALMRLISTDQTIIPFNIGSAKTSRWKQCKLLGFNIAIVDANENQTVYITNVLATPYSMTDKNFYYVTRRSQCGDSGGAVIVAANGDVVAMHLAFLNTVKVEEDAGQTMSAKVKKLQLDSQSGASSSGVSEGLRLDYLFTSLSERGLFVL